MAKIEKCRSVVRLDADRSAIARNGFKEMLEFMQRNATVEVSFRKVWVNADSLVKTGDGLVKPLEFQQRIAAV
ncbi:MAG: hypothetical protein NT035_10015 [Burkholderiales bacterium]|nr:hypothetical protein [Burkholderiales bacterium]